MSYFDDASLVMIPSGYKDQKVYSIKPLDGAGDLAFSRASSATRVASNGLIEKVRTNLLQQSQNLAAAAWSLIGTATRTANYGIAPDGTQTSTRIQWTSAAGFEIYQYTGVAAPVYGSVYIKGTAGQTIRYSGNDVTLNGSWQRIEGGLAIDGANTYFTIVGNTVSNTAFDFQLWGAQAEAGDIATAYIPTTTAAVSVGPVSGLPRLDYLNSTCPRLLLEPQRTNLITYSEQLNTGSGGTTPVTANTAVSPDGYTNADTIGTGYWTKSTSQSAGTYTLSVFAKYQSAATFGLYIYDGAYYQGTFNLQTGVATPASGSPTVSMVSYGNGWYRCTLTATTASTISEVGFGSGNFYGYGLQLEAGAYATSYIPTLGTSVTRVADAASKTSASALIGQTEGTIYWEIDVKEKAATGSDDLLNLDNGSFGDTIYLFKVADGRIACDIFDNSVQQASFILPATSWNAGVVKMALGYANNNCAFFVNGTQVGTTDTSCTIPTMTQIQLGLTNVGGSFGRTAQLLLFKTRLSNSDLAALTA
jgi:hypothetical protein